MLSRHWIVVPYGFIHRPYVHTDFVVRVLVQLFTTLPYGAEFVLVDVANEWLSKPLIRRVIREQPEWTMSTCIENKLFDLRNQTEHRLRFVSAHCSISGIKLMGVLNAVDFLYATAF